MTIYLMSIKEKGNKLFCFSWFYITFLSYLRQEETGEKQEEHYELFFLRFVSLFWNIL